jgi:cell division septation protein DedD
LNQGLLSKLLIQRGINMKRIFLFGAIPLLMAGCVPLLPLPISIVSSGLTGLSLLTTGKSTTDHVVSAANKQDCILHRVAFGEDICRDYRAGEYKPNTKYTNQYPGDREQDTQTAETPNFWDEDQDTNTAELPEKSEEKPKIDPLLISSLTNPSGITGGVSMGLAPMQPEQSIVEYEAEVSSWARPEGAIAVESVELPPLPRVRPSASSVIQGNVGLRFLSLGSFRSKARANNLVKRFAFLNPTVMTIDVEGEIWRRVAVGPMRKRDVEELRRSYSRIDGRNTWSFVR